MVPGRSYGSFFNGPTDYTTQGTTGSTAVFYTFKSGDDITGTTTGTVSYSVPKRYSGASAPWPIPIEELKRAARIAKHVEALKKLKKDIIKGLKADRALQRMRATQHGKLPPRRHPLERARHGFQQMCRIPCYRGVRTR